MGKEKERDLLARRFGPQAVSPPPEIDSRCAFWLRTYQLLSPSRPEGATGVQPIPLTEMAALADIIDMPCTPDEYVTVIRALDFAFLEHVNSKKQANTHGVKKNLH